ncbi:chondroitinase-B domain-containing protein [uncultured Paraglaciecola sp.]|uniref:chondroitinase-B domain-containing protein n=1 Tax=uncultured Paraglaciecola sp. TaxID=1765024 RepID=UPI0030DC14A2|tara:strand:+ start:23949 stop:26330 length:2382 start_codon:yes stop_codon:yes gene_type:complete
MDELSMGVLRSTTNMTIVNSHYRLNIKDSMNKSLLVISAFLLLVVAHLATAKNILVSNEAQLNAAIKNANAGDNIVFKNGTYQDIEIEFYGEGTAENPIVLRAETAGKVFIEGQSNLKIGGQYLFVEGLHFRNGYTPSKAVIRFKIDDEKIAFHSKVTNSVIEEFTQLDRDVSDHWVEFWGQHNELSNNYIAGKSNFGPTVMVQLKGNQHVNNHHQIVNNHFGPRPRKGGPHGETMQIGDSSTSMTPSYTNIENNFFDRCNGEVEIISSKSNFNVFKHNIFFESEGSLVLRHGNYATIDGNVFIGDGESEFFGGIRVINTGHWITNNYFYKLKGEKFRAPIAVMNGIPKSPLNRYNQVTDTVVAYNSWIESPTPWYFSVGSNVDQSAVLPKSEIRSARPIRTLFANNLIYNSAKAEYPIYHYDKVDGVTFKNNISNHDNKTDVQSDGIVKQALIMKTISDGFLVPSTNHSEVYNGFDFDKIETDLFGAKRASNQAVGATISPLSKNSVLVDKTKYGTTWFSAEQQPRESKVFKVANSSELSNAIRRASSGDVIELTTSDYSVTDTLDIDKKITIVSADKNNKSTINFTAKNTAFSMQPKGHLLLDHVIIKGNKNQNAFTTLDKYMSKAYDLSINNSEISDFKNVLEVSKGSFADNIVVLDSIIKNTQNGFLLNQETNDKGDYNSEFVTIKNTSFINVSGSVIDYYRGGYDESTIGGNLVFANNTVTQSGEKGGTLIKNRGIVNLVLEGNTFKNNPVKLIAILWGDKGQKPVDNKISNSGKVEIVQNLKLKLMY